MKTDYMEFDLTPTEEECASVNEQNYREKARMEYIALVAQIKREHPRYFPEISEHIMFSFKGCPHDFGCYYQMKISYFEDDMKAIDFVYKLEGDFPSKWDKEAIKFLKESGYFNL